MVWGVHATHTRFCAVGFTNSDVLVAARDDDDMLAAGKCLETILGLVCLCVGSCGFVFVCGFCVCVCVWWRACV